MSIPDWDIMGHTVVADDFIRLTPDRQSKRGALWNTKAYFDRPNFLHFLNIYLYLKACLSQ